MQQSFFFLTKSIYKYHSTHWQVEINFLVSGMFFISRGKLIIIHVVISDLQNVHMYCFTAKYGRCNQCISQTIAELKHSHVYHHDVYSSYVSKLSS